jgi:hypothetical protein
VPVWTPESSERRGKPEADPARRAGLDKMSDYVAAVTDFRTEGI